MMKVVRLILPILVALSPLCAAALTQTSAQLVVAQIYDPQDPSQILEYGLLRMGFKTDGLDLKKVRAVKIRIPAPGPSEGLIGPSLEVIVENPDLTKCIEFKVSQLAAEILWVLHDKRHMTFAAQVLLDGEDRYFQIPQDLNLEIKTTLVADPHDPSKESPILHP